MTLNCWSISATGAPWNVSVSFSGMRAPPGSNRRANPLPAFS